MWRRVLQVPLLQPETTSMTALNLIQQLSTITRHLDDGDQGSESGVNIRFLYKVLDVFSKLCGL